MRSTSSCPDSAVISRDAVELCTRSSRATSATLASPSRASSSSTCTARSTDCTDPVSRMVSRVVPGWGDCRPKVAQYARYCAMRSSGERLEHGTTRCSWLRSEEHTSELQSRGHLVCRLLLEKKNYHQQ